MNTLIAPGDKLDIADKENVVIGPGVYCDPRTQEIRPVNAGFEVIGSTKKNLSIRVDHNSKRYIPAVGDLVVGLITGSFSDSYRVSLASFSSPVTLSYMAFPNASKKNRPSLKVGDLVYARVCKADKELEAEIECVDSTTGKDAGFGLLDGGMVADVSLAFSRELTFNNEYPLLTLLAKNAQFEIAIGINGKVWIKCDDVKSTLACYRSINDCQSHPSAEHKFIISQHFKAVTNSVQ
ncbi:exosome non-catalytic core subunit RRP40 [Lachancea thermotolerans CBS 6340]|uniref:Ribosomal RNA-processing protein 40 n=1 Tax=Lachancea thermotolerans (strain ATCC 56472 / CBS 6340 / NRRL Y-8284) TaxID=559295 RepID=C5DJW1_LACTC|nr:exosome complex component RRP40 [Lachancea thermotolerans CBS 6340]CAR24600.1 KLTH0F19558p [Lachancea thermotolerans CBS 6340]